MTMPGVDDKAELKALYRELILDHARNPRHFGRLEAPTHTAEGINPLCGDKLKLYLHIEDDRIDAAAFEGSGCAISIASASLMTDLVLGAEPGTASRWAESVRARLSGAAPEADDPALERLRALDGVREFPSRVKCATLAWHALDSAIEHRSEPASTE
jgi:nitrogen fixation NifU-like protein